MLECSDDTGWLRFGADKKNDDAENNPPLRYELCSTNNKNNPERIDFVPAGVIKRKKLVVLTN
jgi:hypothetical protein